MSSHCKQFIQLIRNSHPTFGLYLNLLAGFFDHGCQHKFSWFIIHYYMTIVSVWRARVINSARNPINLIRIYNSPHLLGAFSGKSFYFFIFHFMMNFLCFGIRVNGYTFPFNFPETFKWFIELSELLCNF